MSLQKLFANVFRQKISKNQQLTNWEADILTDKQKLYAATDAWSCIMIYKELCRLKNEGYELKVLPQEPVVSDEKETNQEPVEIKLPPEGKKSSSRGRKKRVSKKREKKLKENT